MTVDLATGAAAGGHAEGDTLTGIENIFGSHHADSLTGDEGDNYLAGLGGDDTLAGGAGDDRFLGGSGADVLDGGEGHDTATYLSSDAGVTVDLATGAAAGGHAEGDTLTGIENIFGSHHADSLTGDEGNNFLWGGSGNNTLAGGEGDDTLTGGEGHDRFSGGSGADVLDGGDGIDVVNYELSDAGVTVDLATGAAAGGHAEGDTLTGIENIWGSHHADSLTGDEGNNALVGFGGADVLDGGEGHDTATYLSSDAGVTVDLATGAAAGGHAEGDTLTGIENIWGSHHADSLTGGDGGDILEG